MSVEAAQPAAGDASPNGGLPLIEVEHGSDQENDPGKFKMLVTFDEQSDGKTVLTLRQMHPSKERRAWAIGFGAVEYGGQTLEKLALHVAKVRRK